MPTSSQATNDITVPARLCCPMTGMIFKKPVTLYHEPCETYTPRLIIDLTAATVEEDAWNNLRRTREQNGFLNTYCPTTGLPIIGYIKNEAMEREVREFLSANPSFVNQQYTIGASVPPLNFKFEHYAMFWCLVLGTATLPNFFSSLILNYDTTERVRATLAGLIGGMYAFFPLVFMSPIRKKNILEPFCYQEGETLLSNIFRGVSCLGLFISIGMMSSLIGELFMQVNPQENISCSHLMQASALGMTLFYAPAIIVHSLYRAINDNHHEGEHARLLPLTAAV